MKRDSRIYIAGHTGLLGRALLERLREKGYTNLITIPHSELSLTDREAVDAFFREERPEYVFLAAGMTGGIAANKKYPAEFLHTNIAIQDSLFESAQRYEVRHLVFYGSSCIYPKHTPQPIREEYLFEGSIEETSAAYAIAKTAGVIACKAYNNQYETNRFIALVPNSIFGPGDNYDLDNSHVLSALIRRFHEAREGGSDRVTLWGSGAPMREFIFSEDVADASIFAMEQGDQMENRHYNVGTGVELSIKELAETVASIIGYHGEIIWDREKPDGTPRKLLDSSRFMTLGWRPSVTLKEGLRVTSQWFCEKSGRSYPEVS